MIETVIFSRTRSGTLALSDAETPLSPGFRRLLKLIDGQRTGRDLLDAMPNLEREDLEMWVGELLRRGFIGHGDEIDVAELAFSLSSKMQTLAVAPESGEAELIERIMADLSFEIEPQAQTDKDRLTVSARMAVIESGSVFESMEQVRFFVQPDAAEGLPKRPRVCIAGHARAQNHLLSLVMKRAGVEAEIAPTRAPLTAIMRGASKPQIVLIDAEMPQLDGEQALETLLREAKRRDIRMVLISERGERADLAKAIMLEAAGYIIKPLRKKVVDAAMPRVIGRPLC